MFRKYLAFILLITFSICLKTSFAQYYPNQGIFVLKYGQAAHGLLYKSTIDLPENFNPAEMDMHISTLAYDMQTLNANVIRIIHRTITNTKYNKRFTRAKHYSYGLYQAELFFTTNPDNIQPIDERLYFDSLRSELISDTSKEALLVYFASPRLQNIEEFPVSTLRYNNVPPCKMDRYSVCSFVITKELPIPFNIGYKNPFTINVKFGNVYFLEYLPTPLGPVRPADFLWAYRTCKDLQKINLQRKQMGE